MGNSAPVTQFNPRGDGAIDGADIVMKIRVKNDSLQGHILFGLWKRFDCSPGEVSELLVMADWKYMPPYLLSWLFKAKPQLRFLMIRGGCNITLDAFADRGFERAVEWLKSHGWDIDNAAQEALGVPLVRVTVSRSVKQ
jgi:hypothetical protein